MPLTLATWNINSIRLRIANVERFIGEAQPDVSSAFRRPNLPTSISRKRPWRRKAISTS